MVDRGLLLPRGRGVLPISPLVGEMSAQLTEGGKARHEKKGCRIMLTVENANLHYGAA